MSREVVDRLAAELRKVLAQSAVKAKFAEAGAEVQPRGAAEFAAYVKAESEKWAALIKQRKIQLD
jgi:tripartite-type tricarboxylate transporter receptor subunit TctC